jgi:hypothetical protein
MRENEKRMDVKTNRKERIDERPFFDTAKKYLLQIAIFFQKYLQVKNIIFSFAPVKVLKRYFKRTIIIWYNTL